MKQGIEIKPSRSDPRGYVSIAAWIVSWLVDQARSPGWTARSVAAICSGDP